ncbi:LysR family transcriptional regulator [Staphylococcus sp. IVB6214]|uniref:LysR family transcriptional regulator n=1 Tax=Staphylococcus sp. IVB6214 TaxID=2989766 RepID=UPI0021CE682F|nr:LysR family transcriptional regulator [Staphylococcus sp. IVB6214]UXR83323.1 LysR family transcriptional regulator [Staphylococcus sp. IVB6214]
MNSKQIDCTLELAKTKNFNQAAKNLFITQPALSYQIKSLENEVGFLIFERSTKGVQLTLAGIEFCERVAYIKEEVKTCIEDCLNINHNYNDVIRICVPYRTAIHFLSDAIESFKISHPNIFIEVTIDPQPYQYQQFIEGKYDLFFGIQSTLTSHKEINIIHLYDSHIFLVVNKDDTLAQFESASSRDLINHTLLVGGGSPPELRQLQNSIMSQFQISTLTSANHETTLINIAAKRGVCLIPGLLNDFNQEFSWIPFETSTTIPCVLCRHQNDSKEHITDFIALLQDFYINHKTTKF